MLISCSITLLAGNVAFEGNSFVDSAEVVSSQRPKSAGAAGVMER